MDCQAVYQLVETTARSGQVSSNCQCPFKGHLSALGLEYAELSVSRYSDAII